MLCNLKSIKNLLLRAVSGIIIVSIFGYSILFSSKIFLLLLTLILLGMIYEWVKMCKSQLNEIYIGIFTIVFAISIICYYLVIQNQRGLILWYFIDIWLVDTLAMVSGKIIQGPKLAPNLSPKKTISGFIFGILLATLCSYQIGHYFHFLALNDAKISRIFLLLTIINGAIAQISDLFVSFFKRKFRIKDSGFIIPGHGGLLDRFDSILITVYFLILIDIFNLNNNLYIY